MDATPHPYDPDPPAPAGPASASAPPTGDPAARSVGADLLRGLRTRAWPDPLASGAGRARGAGPLVLVLVAAVLLAGVWYLLGRGSRSHEVPMSDGTAAMPTPAAGPGRPAGDARSARRLRVHVAGAVARPGVVVLAPGSRVVDALAAAGGPRPDADLDRMNLAARIADGQRVAVPVVGAPPPPLVDDPGAGVSPAGGPEGSPPSEAARIDLNTATAADLEALPGIGPVLAEAILAHRARLGRFRSVEELLGVRGIGERRFADLRDRVRV